MKGDDRDSQQLLKELTRLRKSNEKLKKLELARRKTEEALRESERTYHELAEDLPEVVFEIDLDGHVLFMNKNAFSVFGYTPEDFIHGICVYELVAPEEQDRVRENILSAFAGNYRSNEYLARRQDGTTILLQIRSRRIVRGGKVVGLRAISFDMTEQKRAEHAIRESEEKYRALMHGAGDAILLADFDGNLLEVNKSAEKLLGLPAEVLVGMNIEQIHPPEEQQRIREAFRNIKQLSTGSLSDTLTLKGDGSVVPIDITGSVIEYAGKRVTLAIFRDMREQKQAEWVRQQSIERYRTTLNSMGDWIHVVDQDLRFILFNDAIKDLSRSLNMGTDVIGKTVFEVFTFLPKSVQQEYQQVFATGEVLITVETNTVNTREIMTETRKIPIFEGSKVIQVVTVMQDITARMKAEIELRRSEERYRVLFEESKDMVYIATHAGNFLDINPAGVALLGHESREELLKADIRETYLEPQDRRHFQQTIERDGFVKDYEVRLRRKDGTPITVLITASAVKDSSGKIESYRGIIRDITERRRLEQQLFQAQKMESIGTLAGGIAHDFNNILSGILGYASFMKTKLSSDHPLRGYVDTIEKGAVRAAELTSKLLAFARGGKYETKPVDLNEIVNETVNIIYRTFDKSIEVEPRLHENLPTVDADAGQIQQVLMNLLVNSRDAMPDGGTLIIETGVDVLTAEDVKTNIEASTGQYVTVAVIDSGIGMNREVQQRIFEPFFTTKEKGKGTGLGLAMVYGVVKNHGGFVKVYSEIGRGSTFQVYLPASGKSEEIKKKSGQTRGLHGDELIFVVDDEESICRFARDVFQEFGYRVLTAADGWEAIEIYQIHWREIGLVILDMIMPKSGGLETYLKMKVINPAVKALLSTGYSQNGKAQEILDRGVQGFIQKPYLAHQLLTTVRSVLDH